jgi:urease accessory protein
MAGESISTDLLVSILHHGDSSFPSGGFAFSSGLEEFFIDQMIKNVADLESFIADLLVHRWIGFDAVALRRSYAAASDVDLAEIDRCVEIATLSAAQRAGSKRAGRAILAVYAKLGSGIVSHYRDRAIADQELGHLPVAQGLSWREAGLPIEAALVMSAWTTVQGLATAAIRLGLIGHLQAQHLLFGMRAQVVAAVQSGADHPLDAPLSSFTILSDIALARHERRDARMFIT